MDTVDVESSTHTPAHPLAQSAGVTKGWESLQLMSDDAERFVPAEKGTPPVAELPAAESTAAPQALAAQLSMLELTLLDDGPRSDPAPAPEAPAASAGAAAKVTPSTVSARSAIQTSSTPERSTGAASADGERYEDWVRMTRNELVQAFDHAVFNKLIDPTQRRDGLPQSLDAALAVGDPCVGRFGLLAMAKMITAQGLGFRSGSAMIARYEYMILRDRLKRATGSLIRLSVDSQTLASGWGKDEKSGVRNGESIKPQQMTPVDEAGYVEFYVESTTSEKNHQSALEALYLSLFPNASKLDTLDEELRELRAAEKWYHAQLAASPDTYFGTAASGVQLPESQMSQQVQESVKAHTDWIIGELAIHADLRRIRHRASETFQVIQDKKVIIIVDDILKTLQSVDWNPD